MVPVVSAAFVGSHGAGNSTLVQLEPVERGGQGPLPNWQRQHQPLCTRQSSRISSTRLLLQPSPALRHSGTSSSSYLCKALEKHSCGLLRLKKGRAEGGRATACLLASPHPPHLWLYHSCISQNNPRSVTTSHLSWWFLWSWSQDPGCFTATANQKKLALSGRGTC